MAPSSGKLPPACNGVDPCNDVACQKAIAQTHEITEQDFQSRIIVSAGPPKVLSAADVLGIIAGGLCGTDGLLLDPNVTINADLNPVAGSPNPNMVCYSFPFLKGILADGPDSFSFYVATSSSGGNDVVFSVAFAETPVCYYDQSTYWP